MNFHDSLAGQPRYDWSALHFSPICYYDPFRKPGDRRDLGMILIEAGFKPGA